MLLAGLRRGGLGSSWILLTHHQPSFLLDPPPPPRLPCPSFADHILLRSPDLRKFPIVQSGFLYSLTPCTFWTGSAVFSGGFPQIFALLLPLSSLGSPMFVFGHYALCHCKKKQLSGNFAKMYKLGKHKIQHPR